MNDTTQAGLLLNAANIPCEIFLKLCNDYQPSEILTGPSFWQELGLSEEQIFRLSSLLAKDGWAERELEQVEALNAKFITAKDIDYPAKLFDIIRPPVGLYVQGKVNLSLPSVSIVGTRKCSSYGQLTASGLARALAQNNIITISGGARGIDSHAHRGALSADGITIAVFGTSIDKIYPTENRDLFSRILEHGAIISEYPLNSGGDKWHFPERNKIIAGLASRVVVVEAGEKSGALITAGFARKIGRELWAVPGRINEEISKGTNKLIHDGAKCLYDINAFIETFTGKSLQLDLFDDEKENVKPSNSTPDLSDDDKIIYSLLQRQGGRLIDEIIAESKLDASSVQFSLMSLEAEGLIIEKSGRYSASV